VEDDDDIVDTVGEVISLGILGSAAEPYCGASSLEAYVCSEDANNRDKLQLLLLICARDCCSNGANEEGTLTKVDDCRSR
jgi:hypothetical protein